ncbi:unnamed protein product [Auanema sp. JU1783]|nr:unnamed protein product [Auanema sp. JU1783]
MPLLVVTGYPSSGKSTIVNRIVEYLKERGKSVVVVDDDELNIDRSTVYSQAHKEKDHRAMLKSRVEKIIGKNTTVICDSLNYIKGYRYELFLLAKLVKTTYGVLFCNAEENACLTFDQEKETPRSYGEKMVQELCFRYEKPDRNRWDSPLFEIKIGTVEKALDDEIPDDMMYDLSYRSPRFVNIPLEDIYLSLFEGVPLTENKSTVVAPLAPTNFLHDLDRATQEVVSAIISGQAHTVPGQPIVIDCAEANCNKITFNRVRSAPELARFRRQFISFSKTNPISNPAKIASLFVNYINVNA